MTAATVLAQFEPFFFGLWGFFCLFWIGLIVVGIFVGVWMYKDANRRGENGAFWVILYVILLFVSSGIGALILVIIWLVVRKDEILCDDHGNPLPGREAQYAAYDRIVNIGEKRRARGYDPQAPGAAYGTPPPAGAPPAGWGQAPAGAPQAARKTTCPTCGTVFDYPPNPSGATDVKCPSCGTEGTI